MSEDQTPETGTDRSTERANRRTVEELCRWFNEQDRERFDACYAGEVVVHAPDGPRTMDHDAHWAEVQAMFAAMPDLRAEIHSIAAEGDRVFYRATYSGTYEGEHEPAHGTYVEWAHWSEYRLDDDVIVEAWQLSDTSTVTRELGIPQEPAA